MRKRRPSQGQATSTASGASRRSANRKAASDRTASSSRGTSAASLKLNRGVSGGASALVGNVKNVLLASKPALVAVIVVVLVVVGALWDSAANFGKAYGNVTVAGNPVGGMNAAEIADQLERSYGNALKAASVKVYAGEDAEQREAAKYAQEERNAQAEQVSAGEAASRVTSWTAEGGALGATLDYAHIADEAIAAGRNGGPFARIAVALTGQDVPVQVVFDEEALEEFAATMDKTLGDPRVDATVSIADGVASPVEGHDGSMVDRSWLAQALSEKMLSDEAEPSIVAEAAEAPSRTTLEQAQELSDAVNKALGAGATFTYDTRSWTASASDLGKWTRVFVSQAGDDGYELSASIDSSEATSALVQNLSGTRSAADSGGVTVDFETEGGEVVVHTSGTGEIPEVVPAVEQLDDALYGQSGIAWSADSSPAPVQVSIAESSAPESLTFDQALELGIVSIVGQYTTEFANDEGTENRNHNIRLVSDLLDDTVCESNGGTWSFNDHSGDTNLDPPFASAGSIVDGQYVDSIGGGICQVATTIFNAVFEGGLDVVQRRNHSLYIASYPTGRDVGVSYPELDFVWQNNLQSDVLLKMSYTDTSVTATLYGTYTGYKVESTVGDWEEGETYKTDFETDEDMAKGDYYLKTVGEDGSKIAVTRIVRDKAGNVISEDLFESVYEPKNEVYLIGPGTDTSALVRTDEPKAEDTDDEDFAGDEEIADSDAEDASYDDGEYADAWGYDDQAETSYDDLGYDEAYVEYGE